MADDPLLNCRTEAGVDPVRIICDSCLRIPLDSQLVKTAGKIPLIVAGVPARWTEVQQEKEKALLAAGVTVLHSPGEKTVDLPWLMRELGTRDIDGILLEGGGELNGAALEAGIVQKAVSYTHLDVYKRQDPSGGKRQRGYTGSESTAGCGKTVRRHRHCVQSDPGRQ